MISIEDKLQMKKQAKLLYRQTNSNENPNRGKRWWRYPPYKILTLWQGAQLSWLPLSLIMINIFTLRKKNFTLSKLSDFLRVLHINFFDNITSWYDASFYCTLRESKIFSSHRNAQNLFSSRGFVKISASCFSVLT